MSWPDPTGPVITFLRDNPAVAAICGSRVRGDPQKDDSPPLIAVNDYGASTVAGGANSRQTGLYFPRVVCLCYVPRGKTARVQAKQLALTVAAALDGVSLEYNVGSSGRAAVARMVVESIGTLLEGPDTQDPYVPVIVSLFAGTQVRATI